MINRIGTQYLTSNIEGGEYSYIQEAGSRENLKNKLGYDFSHFKIDIRFEKKDIVILIETKQNYVTKDELQLKEYLDEEKALHPNKKIICILANTNNNEIKVWNSFIDDNHFLKDENVLDTFEHYEKIFLESSKQNDREKVLKNTYALNNTLHKKDIDEDNRSQFVGTALLYIKDILRKKGIREINDASRAILRAYWSFSCSNKKWNW